jgi:hypothetical protein
MAREEYMGICEDDKTQTLLLALFEFYAQLAIENAETNRKKNDLDRKRGRVADREEQPWFTKSVVEMERDLLGFASDKTIRNALDNLELWSFIKQRPNPEPYNDHTKQYLFCVREVQAAVDAWIQSNPHLQPDDDGVRNEELPFDDEEADPFGKITESGSGRITESGVGKITESTLYGIDSSIDSSIEEIGRGTSTTFPAHGAGANNGKAPGLQPSANRRTLALQATAKQSGGPFTDRNDSSTGKVSSASDELPVVGQTVVKILAEKGKARGSFTSNQVELLTQAVRIYDQYVESPQEMLDKYPTEFAKWAESIPATLLEQHQRITTGNVIKYLRGYHWRNIGFYAYMERLGKHIRPQTPEPQAGRIVSDEEQAQQERIMQQRLTEQRAIQETRRQMREQRNNG